LIGVVVGHRQRRLSQSLLKRVAFLGNLRRVESAVYGQKAGEMKLRGKFYSNDPSDLSTAEKHLICHHLGFLLEDDILFEPTAWSLNDVLMGRSPDYTTKSGRKFWIYRPDERLPA